MNWSIAELDALHGLVGLGPEWQRSARRAEIVANQLGPVAVFTTVYTKSPAPRPKSTEPDYDQYVQLVNAIHDEENLYLTECERIAARLWQLGFRLVLGGDAV